MEGSIPFNNAHRSYFVQISDSWIVHHDILKLCTDAKLPFWLRRQRSYLSGLETSYQDLEEQEDIGLDGLFEDQSTVAHISDGSISDGTISQSGCSN